MAEFLQFAFSGLTVGAVYALVALGFTLIYNASGVVNFAQGASRVSPIDGSAELSTPKSRNLVDHHSHSSDGIASPAARMRGSIVLVRSCSASALDSALTNPSAACFRADRKVLSTMDSDS